MRKAIGSLALAPGHTQREVARACHVAETSVRVRLHRPCGVSGARAFIDLGTSRNKGASGPAWRWYWWTRQITLAPPTTAATGRLGEHAAQRPDLLIAIDDIYSKWILEHVCRLPR